MFDDAFFNMAKTPYNFDKAFLAIPVNRGGGGGSVIYLFL